MPIYSAAASQTVRRVADLLDCNPNVAVNVVLAGLRTIPDDKLQFILNKGTRHPECSWHDLEPGQRTEPFTPHNASALMVSVDMLNLEKNTSFSVAPSPAGMVTVLRGTAGPSPRDRRGYGFRRLEAGHSMTIPVVDGDTAAIERAWGAARSYACRNGVKFQRCVTDEGLVITRVQ